MLDGVIASFARTDSVGELLDQPETPAQYIMAVMIDDPSYTGTGTAPQIPQQHRFLVAKEATWFEGIDSNHHEGIM